MRPAPVLFAGPGHRPAGGGARVHRAGFAADVTGRRGTPRGAQVPVRADGLEEWQHRAWEFFDSIGEVWYAIQYVSNAISRMMFFPALPSATPGGRPDRVTDPAALSVVAGMGDIAALAGEAAIHYRVPGECWLLGLAPGDSPHRPTEGTRWEIRAREEIRIDGRTAWLRPDPDHSGIDVKLGPDDVWRRLWVPHPRRRAHATSPLRAILGVCEDLLIWARASRALGRSRLSRGGILFLANDVEPVRSDATADPDGEDDSFFTAFVRAAVTPIQDEGDASAVVPVVARVPISDVNNAANFLDLQRSDDAKILDRIADGLRRLAQGLDLPPEVVTGLADLNHWTAWQVDEATVQHHVVPLARRIAADLVDAYLRDAWVTARVEGAERMILDVDAKSLTRRGNPAETALALHRALVLSDDALRRAHDVSDDDAPSAEELERRLGLSRGLLDSALTESLLRSWIPDLEVRRLRGPGTVEIISGPRDGDTPPPDTTTGAATDPPQPDDATELRTLPTLTPTEVIRAARVHEILEGGVQRARERAGAQLRTRARRDPAAAAAVTGLAAAEIPAALGRSVADALGWDLDASVRGSLTALAPRLRSVLGTDAAWEWAASEYARLTGARIFRPAAGDDLTLRRLAIAITARTRTQGAAP